MFAVAERKFRYDQVKLPHAGKLLIKHLNDFITISLKAFIPLQFQSQQMFQRAQANSRRGKYIYESTRPLCPVRPYGQSNGSRQIHLQSVAREFWRNIRGTQSMLLVRQGDADN